MCTIVNVVIQAGEKEFEQIFMELLLMVLTLSLFGVEVYMFKAHFVHWLFVSATQKSWRGLGSDANAAMKMKARSPKKRMGEAICKLWV